MATRNDPSVRVDEKTNQELYQKAAECLGALFGTPKEPGVFNRPVPDGFKSRIEFVRSILDAEGNRAHLSVMPQPHTATLATVMAARGNPLFPPDLVVEFVARPNEGDDDFDDTASRIERLGLLAEIAELTRDHATGNSHVALKLPFNGRLDFKGSVMGIFDALTAEEAKKLGLDKVKHGGFQEFATDLDGVIGELVPRTLTPMQRFYLRALQWGEQREAARMERERRGRHDRGGDAAAALPQAAVPPIPEPAPAPPAKPVIPDLSALLGGEPAPAAPSRASRASRKAAAMAPAVPAIVSPTAMPAAEELKPVVLTTEEDEDREFMLAAIKKVADGGNVVAKAFISLMKPETTLEEMKAFVQKRKIF